MKVHQCSNGHAVGRYLASKVVGHARRRQYKCPECGEFFSTLEMRVPPNMDVALFHVKLRMYLNKEFRRDRRKPKQAQQDDGAIQPGA